MSDEDEGDDMGDFVEKDVRSKDVSDDDDDGEDPEQKLSQKLTDDARKDPKLPGPYRKVDFDDQTNELLVHFPFNTQLKDMLKAAG